MLTGLVCNVKTDLVIEMLTLVGVEGAGVWGPLFSLPLVLTIKSEELGLISTRLIPSDCSSLVSLVSTE